MKFVYVLYSFKNLTQHSANLLFCHVKIKGCGGTCYGTGCTHQAQYTKGSHRLSLAEVLSVPNESFDSNSLSSHGKKEKTPLKVKCNES